MAMTSEKKFDNYLNWNHLGFFPGKSESETAFIKRVDYCKELLSHLSGRKEFEEIFTDEKLPEADESLQESFVLSEKFYGIKPRWVPLFFSNHQLAPWHGGCAWIFQLDEKTPLAALLQLRLHFAKSERYLKLYDRKELITHELAHVGRMAYEEPKYEELLAYRSSPSSFRRWFGPLLQSSNETLFFVLFLALTLLTDLASLSLDMSEFDYGGGLKWVTAILLFFAMFRLGIRHYYYQKCLKKVTSLLEETEKAEVFTYRLLDSEIEFFAKEPIEIILDYIQEQNKENFRWQFLSRVYGFREGIET